MGYRQQKNGTKLALTKRQFFVMGMIGFVGLLFSGLPLGCLWYEPIRERGEDSELTDEYQPEFLSSAPESGLTKAFTPCEKITLRILSMRLPDDLEEYPNLKWRWFRNETEFIAEGFNFYELPIGEEGEFVVIDVILSDQGFLYDSLVDEEGNRRTGKEMRQTPVNTKTDQLSWMIEFIYREVPEENLNDPDSCYQVK